MEKNKRYSYDAGYKLKVIAYAEDHGNRAEESSDDDFRGF
jgi:hypothetical protein